MNKLCNDFLQEYIKLDSLIKNKMNSEKGISTYIQKMESISNLNSKISCWESDYKLLKNLRWKRNKLVHETLVNENETIKKNDIDAVVDFARRVACDSDPLSLISSIPNHNNSKLLLIVFITIVVLFILLCLIYM